MNTPSDPTSLLSRRRFLWLGAAASAALNLQGTIPEARAATPSPLGQTMIKVPFAAREPRIGMIGLGGRGIDLIGNLLTANAKVLALCDIVPEKVAKARSLVEKAGQRSPSVYSNGPHAYEALTARDDLDLVVIATPWDWHAPMAVSAMENGKHAAVEVPLAPTLAELWKLVDTSEKTRRHCIMLENCCYGYNETLVLNLVRAGLLGSLLYGEAAYLHDLRTILFESKGEGLWRRASHTQRDGNLYPTHGLGPVANYMGINRGDRFQYLVSMSSPQKGLDEYRKAHVPAGDPKWKERYVTGDLNTSLIKTASGLTITLKHEVSNPRPYDRINMIAGTKGVFTDYPPRIYVEGQPDAEAWSPIESYKKDHEHELWRKQGEMARTLNGHGGMDFILCYRLLQCMREGLEPDMDVYDGAAWSAPGPLSTSSVAAGSAPIDFPDYTRGRWRDREGCTL